ncbi:hypothetical protein [Emticicia sp. 17c]|uniref:hypothetical protein n=1 Tax=Emticicia sp. 17c TaxID=3127704 RepID=UPI00301DF607
MKNRYTFLLLAVVLVAGLYPNIASGQATRTWVSGVGDDANPCSRTAPCKTFAGAISKTAAKGEISVLDPGGYGAVTITKSITINGDGTLAGVLGAGVNGIIINAAADDIVIIRSISINGGGSGLNGIKYIAGGQVNVENCTINGIAAGGSGILVDHSAKALLTVRNTTITGPLNTMNGISIKTSSATDTAKAFIENSNIQGLATAITARDRAIINLNNCVVSNNYKALYTEVSTSLIRVSNTSVYNNTIGVDTGLGKIVSFGNNQVAGNLQSAPMTSVMSSQ